MALLISQDLAKGPNGASVSTSDVGATSQTGTAPTYSNAHAFDGKSFSTYWAGSTGSIRWDFTASAKAYLSLYVHTPASPPASNQTFMTAYSGATTQIASFRWQSDGTLGVRDVNAALSTTSIAVPSDTDIRIDMYLEPGSATGVRVRVFWGGGLNGSTPNATATTSATSSGATSVDNIRLGAVSGGLSYWMARLRVDDAAYPAPISGAGPAIVDAGPDQTKETGGSAFTITAVETPGSGTITTRAWRIVSGTTVTLSGTTTKTVTVTPPATTGVTVLGYKVTDDTPLTSDEDTVTITWVKPGQSYRPTADVAANSWTPSTGSDLWACLDETTPDFTDFIESPDLPTGQEVKVRLAPGPAPTSLTGGLVVEVLARLSAAVTTQSTVITLYDSDGTTVRKAGAAVTTLTTDSAGTLLQVTLTQAEASAITGWASGLVLGIKATLT